jgi:hypothetical protein
VSATAHVLVRGPHELTSHGRLTDSSTPGSVLAVRLRWSAAYDSYRRAVCKTVGSAPWSIYPFSPIDCVGLICDFLFFDTTVSTDALVENLERAGLRGEVLLARTHGKLEGDMPVVRAYWRDRAIT